MMSLQPNLFYLQQDCPMGYQTIADDSAYCYKVIQEKLTWESARIKCKGDDGELVCFSNKKEGDRVTAACDKIIRYVKTWLPQSWSVCRKSKQGILETNIYFNLLPLL